MPKGNNDFDVRVAIDGGDLAPASQVPATANNNAKDKLADDYGRLWIRVAAGSAALPTTPDALTWSDSTASGTNGLVRSKVLVGAHTLAQLHVINSVAAQRYVHLFDAAALPVDTTVPLMTFPLPGSGSLSMDLRNRSFALGLVVAISSTITPLTIIIADEAFISIGEQ